MEIGNAELQKHLGASQRSQKSLTMEVCAYIVTTFAFMLVVSLIQGFILHQVMFDESVSQKHVSFTGLTTALDIITNLHWI